MTFTNELFLFLFLPLCIAFCMIMPKVQMKNNVLLIFSLIFYAWGEQLYLLLIIALSLVNFFAARLFGERTDKISGKAIFIAALALNIASFAVPKYFGGCISWLRLPIGLSFFTLQNISYITDCFTQRCKPCRSFRKYLLLVSLFPKAAAGPVCDSENLLRQIDERTPALSDVFDGFFLTAVGLFKKLIIADNLYCAADRLLLADKPSLLSAWYGAALFMLTVYFDLSAYSDMAVGLAGIFGFKLQSNFNYPFAAASVTDFFRRWHITVTDFFFRRLPQIPGFSKLRGFGAAVIMLVFGLWHGAQIRFLLWGAFFAVIITLETLIGKARLKKIPSPIRRVATIVLVTVGFGALAFPDWQTLSAYLKALVGKGAGLWLARDIENAAEFMPLAVLSALMTIPTAKIIGRKAARSPIGEAALYTTQIIFTLAMLALAAVMLAGTDVRDFLCIKL